MARCLALAVAMWWCICGEAAMPLTAPKLLDAPPGLFNTTAIIRRHTKVASMRSVEARLPDIVALFGPDDKNDTNVSYNISKLQRAVELVHQAISQP